MWGEYCANRAGSVVRSELGSVVLDFGVEGWVGDGEWGGSGDGCWRRGAEAEVAGGKVKTELGDELVEQRVVACAWSHGKYSLAVSWPGEEGSPGRF